MGYKYYYQIRTFNLYYGCRPLQEFKTLAEAQEYYDYYIHRYGACDIIKHRVYS